MVTECVSVRAASTSKLAGTRKPVPSSAAAEVTARVVTMMTAEATARIVTMMAAKVTARIVPAAVATTVTAAMAATTTAAAALAPRSVSYWRQRQRNTHRQYRNEFWFHVALPVGSNSGLGSNRISRLIPILSKADSLGIPKSPAT
jgi:phosphoribosylanthranilate isomerase